LLPRNPATGLPSILGLARNQPLQNSTTRGWRLLAKSGFSRTRDHTFLVLTNETACPRYFHFADVPLFPMPSHPVLESSTCGRASAQNPRLAQCAKREGRQLTHAVVLVKGRRTLCLLFANFSAVCFFKYIPHLLPSDIFFSAHTEQLLRSRRSSTRINTHSSILNLPLCISPPALQRSVLRLHSIQQHQQHRLTLRAIH
jgi:hypothetical protein